jgi:hypothetical protein
VGPGDFSPEPVGVPDVLCCALELGTAVAALLLTRRAGRPAGERGRRVQAVLALSLGLLLVGGTTSVALASPAAQEHGAAHASGHAGHGPCPTAPVLTRVLDARGVDTGVTAFFTCQLLHEHDRQRRAGRARRPVQTTPCPAKSSAPQARLTSLALPLLRAFRPP